MITDAPTNGVAAAQLKSIVERIERLHEERDAIASDIKDVYAEGKSNGWNIKAVKLIVAERRMDASKRSDRDEVDAIAETYRIALGMA